MSAPRILIAGIGNIFRGDDAFGVEVVRRLAHLRRTLTAEEMQGRLEWLSAWGAH